MSSASRIVCDSAAYPCGRVDARRGPQPREADPRAKTPPQRPLDPSDREDHVPGTVDGVGGAAARLDRPGPVGLLQRRGGPALHHRRARRRVVVAGGVADRQLEEARPQELDGPHGEHLRHARRIGRPGVHPPHDRLARHPIDDPQLGAPGLGAGHHGHQGGGRRRPRPATAFPARRARRRPGTCSTTSASKPAATSSPRSRTSASLTAAGAAGGRTRITFGGGCGAGAAAARAPAGQQSGERDHRSERAAAARDHRA